VKQNKGNILAIVLTLFLAVSLGISGYLIIQNQQLKNASVEKGLSSLTPTPTIIDETAIRITFTSISELETLAKTLDGLIKTATYSEIAELITQTEIVCNSQKPYNPPVCLGLADGKKTSGFSIGRYQSEGSTISKEAYIKDLSNYLRTNKNLSYLGQITATPSGLVWLDNTNNSFLAFFVNNNSGKWRLDLTLFGQATPDILNLEKFW